LRSHFLSCILVASLLIGLMYVSSPVKAQESYNLNITVMERDTEFYISGATVKAQPFLIYEDQASSVESTTDVTGLAKLNLVSGIPYGINIQARYYKRCSFPFSWVPSYKNRDISITKGLVRILCSVTFQVTDDAGLPLKYASILLSCVKPRVESQIVGLSDATGKFSVSKLKAGEYNVTVLKRGYETFTGSFTFEKDTEFNIALKKISFNVTFHVADQTGAPIKNVVIALTSTTELPAAGLTDSNGNLTLSITYGNYNVTALKIGYETFRGSYNFTGSTIVNITMKKYVVTIYVIDKNNNPVSDASVYLNYQKVGSTDSKGTLVISIGSGEYVVTAQKTKNNVPYVSKLIRISVPDVLEATTKFELVSWP